MPEAVEESGAHRTVTIRRSLIRNLVLLIVFLTGSILLTTVYTGRRITDEMSRALIERALERTEADLRSFFSPVEQNILLSRQLFGDGLLDLDDPHGLNRYFIPLLERLPQLSGISIGDAGGRGYTLLRFPDRWRSRLTWTDRWGDRLEYAEWHDSHTRIREWTVEDPTPEERFDPRTRDWYRTAVEAAAEREPGARPPRKLYWTQAYRFFTTGEPGVAAMVHVYDAKGRPFVLAFDVELRDVSDFTRNLEVSPSGFGFMTDEEARVWGLPGLPRFEQEEVRRRALLRYPAELGVPVLVDGARAVAEAGDDRPDTFSFASGGETHWARIRPMRLGANREVQIVVAVPQRDLVGAIQQQRLLLVGVSLLGFAVAVAMAMGLARVYSRPLAALARNSQRIGALELGELTPVESDLEEVDQLAGAQESMRVALDSFARYVPVEIIRELLTRGEAARIGGSRRSVTALFTDIRGFTSISESLSPEALTAHVGEYFDELLRFVQDDGYGTVIQLNGDGLIALWGAPAKDEEHARHAIEAVQACRDRLVELDRGWVERGLPALPTRFGLASGPVVVGNVGAPSRLVYTAMGDTVNLASRLEGLSRFYGTDVLASGDTKRAAGDGFAWRLVDRVRVKGKARAEEVFELLGRSGEVPREALSSAARYEEALAAFLARDFKRAADILEELADEGPGDLSVERLLQRACTFADAPPGESWDGVSEFYEK